MRETKLTEKDMSVIREMESTKKQAKRPFATLKDYSLKHRVTMQWDLNEESQKDQMFKIKIDDKEVILDAEEVQRYIRWI